MAPVCVLDWLYKRFFPGFEPVYTGLCHQEGRTSLKGAFIYVYGPFPHWTKWEERLFLCCF